MTMTHTGAKISSSKRHVNFLVYLSTAYHSHNWQGLLTYTALIRLSL